jgi:hypothetical protein
MKEKMNAIITRENNRQLVNLEYLASTEESWDFNPSLCESLMLNDPATNQTDTARRKEPKQPRLGAGKAPSRSGKFKITYSIQSIMTTLENLNTKP